MTQSRNIPPAGNHRMGAGPMGGGQAGRQPQGGGPMGRARADMARWRE